MIYHIQTYYTYGYWPEDLKPQSNKLIIAACDNCGKIRILKKCHYKDLCQSCTSTKRNIKRYEDPLEHKKSSESALKRHKNNPMSDETKEKMSITQTKRYEDPIERKKNSEGHKKLYEDPLERKKQSIAQLKRYAKIDDPGLVIVGHHIAYDFDRPEAFIVRITSRFHGQIHNPKGVQRHKRGYSLID